MPEPYGRAGLVSLQTGVVLTGIHDVLAPLLGCENDPRVASDMQEISRQVARLEALRVDWVPYRDRKYRERRATRIIEQRAARALRKLACARPDVRTMDCEDTWGVRQQAAGPSAR